MSVARPREAEAATSQFRFSPRPNRAGEIGWRAWGEKAFQEAQAAGKPILLSISAVWCHWCHVMDETSYSDPEVIRLANERFVPVRVDNDERPDVNRRYNMGGWPTTAFLTPDGEIVHGGTYIPPDAMRSNLAQVADLWSERREELARRVAEIQEKETGARAAKPGDLTWEIVDAVGSLVRGQYDPQFGGFGREPKFPQPKLLRFLIDEHRRFGYPELATMLHKTLGAMAAGGMYDHVAGGFFRYSFPNAGYDRVVRDVIRWMDAVLWRDEVQLFAGSQDADEHYYALDAAERAKHDAPFVDRTPYTAWNALAASAYVAAGEALADDRLRERGRAAAEGIDRRVRDETGALYHFDAGGGPKVADLLGDLAAYLAALLDTYEAAIGEPALRRAAGEGRRDCAPDARPPGGRGARLLLRRSRDVRARAARSPRAAHRGECPRRRWSAPSGRAHRRERVARARAPRAPLIRRRVPPVGAVRGELRQRCGPRDGRTARGDRRRPRRRPGGGGALAARARLDRPGPVAAPRGSGARRRARVPAGLSRQSGRGICVRRHGLLGPTRGRGVSRTAARRGTRAAPAVRLGRRPARARRRALSRTPDRRSRSASSA